MIGMKKILGYLSIFLLAILVYFTQSYYPRLTIVTGFSAKNLASGMFLAGRTQNSIETGDNNFSLLPMATNVVNKGQKLVDSKFFGFKDRKAIFTPGLGALLLPEGIENIPSRLVPNRIQKKNDFSFPYGNNPQKDTLFENVNYQSLHNAVEEAFDRGGEEIKKTRTVLVVYKDQILAEKYADGFDENTPMLGWSMTKSITSTIYGILQFKGLIDIFQKTGLKEWENDDRSKITYNNLLQMNSGLEWDEDYGDLSDVTKMLYVSHEMGKVQLLKKPVGKPNENWNYSSGTSNLLAGYLLRKNFPDEQSYTDFWYRELFDKIGMHSAIVETDYMGNFVGSSYGWATTRDWAKFGLLYLHRGNWNGEQIFSENWADYVSTPTNGSNGVYGGHFWLNAGGKYPDVPKDMFSANGFQGQMVIIVPSKDLVIVRTGLTEDPEFDFNAFIGGIVSSIK